MDSNNQATTEIQNVDSPKVKQNDVAITVQSLTWSAEIPLKNPGMDEQNKSNEYSKRIPYR
jgi:hypothetical protein